MKYIAFLGFLAIASCSNQPMSAQDKARLAAYYGFSSPTYIQPPVIRTAVYNPPSLTVPPANISFSSPIDTNRRPMVVFPNCVTCNN